MGFSHIRKLCLFCLALWTGNLMTLANGLSAEDSLARGEVWHAEAHVSFRVGSPQLDTGFDNNAARLDAFIESLTRAFADTTIVVTRVDFSGMASPEGSNKLNAMLSRQRMEAMESYVRNHIAIPDSIVTYTDRQVPWEYLDSLVSSSDMGKGAQVSQIIRHTPPYIYNRYGRIVDGRKKQLMDLDYGRVWHEMNRRFFPSMRRGCAVAFAYVRKPEPPLAVVRDTLSVAVLTPEPVPADTLKPADTLSVAETKKPRWRVFTNLLYWAALSWNGGVEYALNDRSTLSLSGACAWWSHLSNERVYRWMDAELAWHYYFRPRQRHSGFYLGAYAQTGSFEMMFGKKNRKGETLAGGISGGYRWLLNDRLSLHTEIGLGYAYTDYRYAVYTNRTLVRQGQNYHHYVGPTRVAVSLVYELNGRTRR